jgi:hypothetical protein
MSLAHFKTPALCERAFGFGVRLAVLNIKVAKEFIPTAAFDNL